MPPLTDREYDDFLDAVRAYEVEDPKANRAAELVGAAAAGVATGDVPHPTPML